MSVYQQLVTITLSDHIELISLSLFFEVIYRNKVYMVWAWKDS